MAHRNEPLPARTIGPVEAAGVMATPSERLMTADELMALPDDGMRHELDEGRLVSVPPSGYKSSRVGSLLGVLLGGFIRLHRLGIFAGLDGGLRLRSQPDTVRAPDFSFVSQSRVVDSGSGYFPGAPDLAVEVLSPSDRFSKVLQKVREYLAAGTRLVWIVDPEDRSVVVFRADGSTTLLGEHDSLAGEDVIPGFTLTLTEIWVD